MDMLSDNGGVEVREEGQLGDCVQERGTQSGCARGAICASCRRGVELAVSCE